MKEKIVIYTALFGDYDDVVEMCIDDERIDFVLFTDRSDLCSECWDIRIVSNVWRDSAIANRYYKLHPHIMFSDYKYSIYIDANISIQKNPVLLVEEVIDKQPIAAIKHPNRTTIIEEGLACIARGKSGFFKTVDQIVKYVESGYAFDNSFTANYVLIREHNNKHVVKVMECVWDHLHSYTARDQISLPFCSAHENMTVLPIEQDMKSSGSFFIFNPHRSTEQESIYIKVFRRCVVIFRYFIFSVPYYLALYFSKVRSKMSNLPQ